jgi:hypothetical protein
MKYLVLIMISLFLSVSCTSQEEVKEKNNIQPKESWNVEKKYDEHGNIIRYDSTYSWSYSNFDGDSVTIGIASIMSSFRPFFDNNYSSIWEEGFGNPIWNDSLLYHDFFSPNYFYNRYKQNFFEMENMMRRMDSIRMDFFKNSYPGLQNPTIKKTK